MSLNEGLLETIEKIKLICIGMATGGSPDENEYKNCRTVLLKKEKVKNLLPKFVRICTNLSEFWDYIKPKYAHYKERRTYITTEFYPLIDFLENNQENPILANTAISLSKLNSVSVHELWEKATDRLKNDPEGAITIANTLLTGTIKKILNDLGVEYSDEKDGIPKLYNLLAKNLNLSGSQHREDIFKQILGGCNSVVLGLSTLRNKMGDAHTEGKKPVKPALRHAELAVNLAGAMSIFLISTWENKKKV